MNFAWLKRYVPRGIYGRAALILLLPVVFLQLVVVVIFAQRHFEGVTNQMTDTVLRELELVMLAIGTAPDAQSVPMAVEARAGPLDFVITLPNRPLPEKDSLLWYDYSGRVLMPRMRSRMEGIKAFDLSDNDFVVLYVESVHGPLRIQFERRRISASNPHQLFVNMVFFGGLMTAIAFFYLRNQLRPVTELAEAAATASRLEEKHRAMIDRLEASIQKQGQDATDSARRAGFDKLDAELAKALMSLPAAKGVEIGAGFSF